jgi:hypothetical protein
MSPPLAICNVKASLSSSPAEVVRKMLCATTRDVRRRESRRRESIGLVSAAYRGLGVLIVVSAREAHRPLRDLT